jgi:hypothetical protein
MGTITISVDNETERKFREVAIRVHGKRKGALGEATTEALNLWVKEKMQEEISRTYTHGKGVRPGRPALPHTGGSPWTAHQR